jgi:hypothetical protein
MPLGHAYLTQFLGRDTPGDFGKPPVNDWSHCAVQ